jgi:hypothetical protein
MATEKQYAFFKSLYDEENERTKILGEHAKNNLGLVAVYSAFILFVADKNADHLQAIGKSLFVAAVLFMLLAFLLSLVATQISVFCAVADPDQIFAAYGDEPPTDEEFFDDRIIDYSTAYERNSSVNDQNSRVTSSLFLRPLSFGDGRRPIAL